MVIRNSCGTIYKLKGPNPLMKEQDQWNKFKIHNFNWEPESKSDSIPETPQIKSDFAIKESKPEPEPEPRIEPSREFTTKSTAHCLPVVIEVHKDSLYDEIKSVSKYGDKFLFEFLLVSQNDMVIVFWTDIKLENGSIIYPINKDKRWWKINKREKKESGYLYSGINSDICPDFT